MTEIMHFQAGAGLGLHVNSYLTTSLWNLALSLYLSTQKEHGTGLFAWYFN
jgi:hypothetical protein